VKKSADAVKQKTDGLFTQATKEDLSPKISIISQSTLHLQRKLGLFLYLPIPAKLSTVDLTLVLKIQQT